MSRLSVLSAVLGAALVFLFVTTRNNGASAATKLPDPTLDESKTGQKSQEQLVLAGGCFWGMQAVFEHVKGVSRVTAGYSGGMDKHPNYEAVSSGSTGHAESVEIAYDPSQVTAGQLLKVFFSVAHDPTELNRQGPDAGTQYRSAIFFASTEQRRIAQSYVEQLDRAKSYPRRIVTQVAPLTGFYRAEEYHQGYAAQHPNNSYIARFDLPKVKHLEQEFPNLYH